MRARRSKIALNTKLLSWDNSTTPLSTAKGVIHYENFIKDITFREEYNDITFSATSPSSNQDRKKQPQFRIVSEDGSAVRVPLPGSGGQVEDGSLCTPGTSWAKHPV